MEKKTLHSGDNLARKVATLVRPGSYPEKTGAVIPLETHMSWVFLTDHYAYKLKKPVCCDFLDFSSLNARYLNCRIEVRLNRRLAADVYYGIVPLTVDRNGKMALDENGTVMDWLVKMRRLPSDRMLDFRINRQAVRHEEVCCLADILAHFYKGLSPASINAAQYLDGLERSIRSSSRELIKPGFGLPAGRINRITSDLLQFIKSNADALAQRVHEGYVVEGHGDLRPEHICMERVPLIFDCLEFNRQFRTLDAADDLGFLSMECKKQGYLPAKDILFSHYRHITGDRVSARLISFYQSMRALLRAKLAIWHTLDQPIRKKREWYRQAVTYLDLAESA